MKVQRHLKRIKDYLHGTVRYMYLCGALELPHGRSRSGLGRSIVEGEYYAPDEGHAIRICFGLQSSDSSVWLKSQVVSILEMTTKHGIMI